MAGTWAEEGAARRRPAGGGQKLTVRVRDVRPGGADVTTFRLKARTAMKHLMRAMAQRSGVGAEALRFSFRGEQVRGDQTPAVLGLRSQDVIDCEWAREESSVWKKRRVEAAEGKEDYSDEEEEDKAAAELQQELARKEETRRGGLTAASASPEVIAVGFVNATSGKQTVVSARRAARLEAVFGKLAMRSGIPRHSLRFMIDGLSLSGEDTSATFGLESGSVIEWELEAGAPVDCQLQAGGRPCSVCARSLSMAFADGVYDEAASDQRPAEMEAEPVTLRVVDQTGEVGRFDMMSDSKFEEVSREYAWRNNVNPEGVQLSYKGILLMNDQTPRMVGLRDQSTIECEVRRNKPCVACVSRDLEAMMLRFNLSPPRREDLHVRIINETGSESVLRVEPSTSLQTVINVYMACKRHRWEDVLFFFRGSRTRDYEALGAIPVKDDDIILSAPRIGDAVCLTCKASMRKEDASRTGQALGELETHHWLGGRVGSGGVVGFFETPEHGGLSGFAERCGLLSVQGDHLPLPDQAATAALQSARLDTEHTQPLVISPPEPPSVRNAENPAVPAVTDASESASSESSTRAPVVSGVEGVAVGETSLGTESSNDQCVAIEQAAQALRSTGLQAEVARQAVEEETLKVERAIEATAALRRAVEETVKAMMKVSGAAVQAVQREKRRMADAESAKKAAEESREATGQHTAEDDRAHHTVAQGSIETETRRLSAGEGEAESDESRVVGQENCEDDDGDRRTADRKAAEDEDAASRKVMARVGSTFRLKAAETTPTATTSTAKKKKNKRSKPRDAAEPPLQIAFRLKDPSGQELLHTMNTDEKLQALALAYAEKYKVAVGNVRFSLDGESISLETTPRQLLLLDDDVLCCTIVHPETCPGCASKETRRAADVVPQRKKMGVTALQITDEFGIDMRLELPSSTPVAKAFDKYKLRTGRTTETLVFFHDGKRVHGSSLPAAVGDQGIIFCALRRGIALCDACKAALKKQKRSRTTAVRGVSDEQRSRKHRRLDFQPPRESSSIEGKKSSGDQQRHVFLARKVAYRSSTQPTQDVSQSNIVPAMDRRVEEPLMPLITSSLHEAQEEVSKTARKRRQKLMEESRLAKKFMICIKEATQDGRHVFYKTKGTTKMKKLFATYAKSNHAEPQNLRFVQNGTHISDDDTPSMLQADDDGVISCTVERGEPSKPDSPATPTEAKSPAETNDPMAIEKPAAAAEAVTAEMEEKAASNEASAITLRVTDLVSEDAYFTVKTDTSLGNMFKAYAAQKQSRPGSIRFVHNGSSLTDDCTPAMLGLKDHDAIYCAIRSRGSR